MGKTIMVVDDEPDILEIMKEMLNEMGYTVLVYTSAKNALLALREAPTLPDLLITDVWMPEMSGPDLCKELRKSPKFDKLKIVFCTVAFDLDRSVLKTYNVAGFIFKPFNVTSFARQVENFLNE